MYLKFAPIYANFKNKKFMQQVVIPQGTVALANDEALVPIVNPKKFSFVVNKMRTFFLQKGFVEVHTQNRLSILAACKTPTLLLRMNIVEMYGHYHKLVRCGWSMSCLLNPMFLAIFASLPVTEMRNHPSEEGTTVFFLCLNLKCTVELTS